MIDVTEFITIGKCLGATIVECQTYFNTHEATAEPPPEELISRASRELSLFISALSEPLVHAIFAVHVDLFAGTNKKITLNHIRKMYQPTQTMYPTPSTKENLEKLVLRTRLWISMLASAVELPWGHAMFTLNNLAGTKTTDVTHSYGHEAYQSTAVAGHAPRTLYRVQHERSFTDHDEDHGFVAQGHCFLHYRHRIDPARVRKHLNWFDQSKEHTPFISLFDFERKADYSPTQHLLCQYWLRIASTADAQRRFEHHGRRGDTDIFMARVDTADFVPYSLSLALPKGLIEICGFEHPETNTLIFPARKIGRQFGINDSWVRSEWLAVNSIPPELITILSDNSTSCDSGQNPVWEWQSKGYKVRFFDDSDWRNEPRM
jgi:hypothetical protein